VHGDGDGAFATTDQEYPFSLSISFNRLIIREFLPIIPHRGKEKRAR
jgi:hypothetical protein